VSVPLVTSGIQYDLNPDLLLAILKNSIILGKIGVTELEFFSKTLQEYVLFNKNTIFCAINRKIMSKQLEMMDCLMGFAQTANQSRAGATNRSENIIIRYVSVYLPSRRYFQGHSP
jgi:hypothetical protein